MSTLVHARLSPSNREVSLIISPRFPTYQRRGILSLFPALPLLAHRHVLSRGILLHATRDNEHLRIDLTRGLLLALISDK